MRACSDAPIAGTDATMAASLACSSFGLSGFRALAPSPCFAERAVPDNAYTASFAALRPPHQASSQLDDKELEQRAGAQLPLIRVPGGIEHVLEAFFVVHDSALEGTLLSLRGEPP